MTAVLFAMVLMGAMSRARAAGQNPTGIDFSYAGYGAGEQPPVVPAVLRVRPTGGDDTELVQGALGRIAAMPVQRNGFRGALLLEAGVFHIAGDLQLSVSGVVLRGAGVDRTTLLAEGTRRRTMIEVGGRQKPAAGTEMKVTEDAPAGAMRLAVERAADFHIGDRIVIRRPSTAEWIAAIAMTGLPGAFAAARLDWKPDSHDLYWDRTIVALDLKKGVIQIDAPITTALESRYGGGFVASVKAEQALEKIGIEGLTLQSAFDASRPKDEDHSWIAILFDNVQDAWVRSVTARHFVSSAVRVNWRGRRITVEHARSEAPIAEAGGYRRQAFLVYGQQVLVRDAYSEAGMNDFGSGLLAGGPNVFLDCVAQGSLGASGSFEGWSSGVLYENVKVPQQRLQLILDFARAQGGGWTAANSIIWNSEAQSLDALGPPGAPNFVVQRGEPLYQKQLEARLGQRKDSAQPATSAAGEVAEFLLKDNGKESPPASPLHPVSVVGGRFVVDGGILWGPSATEAWWRGDTSPLSAARTTGSSVTRFLPGITAQGETEDLAAMADRIKSRNEISIQVNPGLWYEHRRDAHTNERRADGEVWAPFYEQPWARSGVGYAWDGLSKYDLRRYNPWYFERQKEFAHVAAERGFVVLYDLYNTHDVLEIGPHWIDYAWRPANNINDTGLPEPPPLRPHNRNDVGNDFYSISYGPLRALHRAYILHTLDVLGEEPNMIFGIAYQYAGPLEFEQFFQDVAREWEQQHHRKVRIALTTSKQTTDAILADAVRSKQIAVVDMRYWEYRPDGSLFAPVAGENHAFRELIAKEFPGYSDTPPVTTPEQVYRQVREYRDRHPEIAFMPMENGAGPIPILMAGAASRSGLVGGRGPTIPPTPLQQASGVFPTERAEVKTPATTPPADSVIDTVVRNYLAHDLMHMVPQDGWTARGDGVWTLADGNGGPVLLYTPSGDSVALSHALPKGAYEQLWIDPRTGAVTSRNWESQGAGYGFVKPDRQEWLLLLRPKGAAAKCP